MNAGLPVIRYLFTIGYNLTLEAVEEWKTYMEKLLNEKNDWDQEYNMMDNWSIYIKFQVPWKKWRSGQL